MPAWRPRCLEAAAEIFETEGPDALSVRRIAAAAGVAPMGVYNHFESKYGHHRGALHPGLRPAPPTPSPGSPTSSDPYEAMREGGRRYRALALEQPMVYQLMFLQVVPGVRAQ